MSDEKSKEVITALFPGEKEVEVAEGVSINVHPISLQDLPKSIDIIEELMVAYQEHDGSIPDMVRYFVTNFARKIVTLLPFCTDADLSRIPGMSGLPAIVETIIDQNVNEYVVGKWATLATKIMKIIPGEAVPAKVQETGEKSEEKSE